MEQRGRKVSPIQLTDEELEHLGKLLRRRNLPNGEARRAKALMRMYEGANNKTIAEELGVCNHTVGIWRKRFAAERLQGISELPRSGAPRTIGDEKVQQVVTMTLEEKPEDATHWSTRSMAKRCGLSHDSVSRIWKAFGLAPHKTESFQLSTDPNFVDKVRDVTGLYLSPPENALVFCVDEKSQVQALERNQPVLPLRPGQPERRSWDYWRHGTLNLFAALNVQTGEVLGKCYSRHRSSEFLAFLREVEKSLPERSDEDPYEVHLVMDNYVTHKAAKVNAWLAKRPHWHIHFTPTYSSWLNQVERFFGIITDKQIRRSSFNSLQSLRDAIYSFIEKYNQDPKPFNWTADADLILGKVERICSELR